MIWGLLRLNPLASFLGAMLITSLLYAGILKFENFFMSSRIENYQAAEAQRERAVLEATKRAKAAEEQGKRQSEGLQRENERLKKEANGQRERIDDLVKRLRDARPCAVPIPATSSEGDIGTSTAKLPRPGRDVFAELVGEYADLAKSAEQVRLNLLTCQAYVKGL